MDMGLDRRGVCQERAVLPLPKMTGFSRKGKRLLQRVKLEVKFKIFWILGIPVPLSGKTRYMAQSKKHACLISPAFKKGRP
jgi:hypothetical protein